MHLQTILKNPFTGKDVKIDNNIVDLIKILWSHKIQTSLSCQDTDGRCFLEFPIEDAFSSMLFALLKILGVVNISDPKSSIINVRYTPKLAFKGYKGTIPEGYQIMFDKYYIEEVIEKLEEFLTI